MKNRQRRAAKKRKRQRNWHGPKGPAPTAHDEAWGGFDGYAVAHVLLHQAVAEARAHPSDAAQLAHTLVHAPSVTPALIGAVFADCMADMLSAVVGAGWSPADLAHVVRRRAATDLLPPLTALLTEETRRHPADRVAGRWTAELSALEPGQPLDLHTVAGVELGLRLAGVLVGLPAIPPVISPPGADAGAGADRSVTATDRRQLARVRALLAKAESTEYAEEAEALSAKAQELITRHALDHLLQRAAHADEDLPVSTRRIWIDAPYVMPKAMLLDEVAGANRCRSVLCEDPGFTTIVGEPADLDAVEVLATSLLVQANSAMLRCGRQRDHWGNSTTTSFRRSFLMSYALRVGERLRSANADAADQTGRSDLLLPVLRRQSERVDDAYAELFPDVVGKRTTMSNHQGWAAGRAAADLAMLDRNLNITA